MARFLRLGTLLAMVGVLAASTALAGIPDPLLSTVPNVVYCPKADLTYKVTVMSSLGPVGGASVEVRINGAINNKLCWCTAGGDAPSSGSTKNASPVSFTKTANGVGVASFNIAAGGCVARVPASRIIEVFANSIKIGEVGGLSPDAVDQTGKLPFDTGYNPTQCEVGLADSSYLTPAFKGAANFCGDFNSSGSVSLADVVIFTPHAKGAHSCTRK